MNAPIHVIEWCAEECERQQSGEMSVYNMVRAWLRANTASRRRAFPRYQDILDLGRIVEPDKNARGIRAVPVFVAGNRKMEAGNVFGALTRLIEHGGTLAPGQWYREFEDIHPFVDGNGRVGALLYNWLADTLETPEVPPDYWSHA